MLPCWRQGLEVARYFTFTAPVSDLLEWLVSSMHVCMYGICEEFGRRGRGALSLSNGSLIEHTVEGYAPPRCLELD